MATVEEQFRDLLRQHRKRAGLSQAQLAELIERQTNAIQRLEGGEASPTLEMLERLATALKIEIRDFFGVGHYAVRADRTDPLSTIFKQVVGLDDEDLEKLSELITAALKMRK